MGISMFALSPVGVNPGITVLKVESLWQPATPLTMDDKILFMSIPATSHVLDGVYEANTNKHMTHRC